jgi:flagellar biosynthesis/type III secretory pathway chaperone
LKDVLSPPLIKVCKNLENLVAINEECPQKILKYFPKGKFFDKVIKKKFILLHTLTYRNHDFLCWGKLHLEKIVKFGTRSCTQTP